MPLKLNVGLSKKVGLPAYGSLGASCHVEVELDSALLATDLDGFHHKVRQAYVACHQAVSDELHRHSSGDNGSSPAGETNGNGKLAATGNGTGRQRDKTRRATASQVRALEAIARRQQLDLPALLQQQFGAGKPAELSITEASSLIEQLNGNAASGGRR